MWELFSAQYSTVNDIEEAMMHLKEPNEDYADAVEAKDIIDLRLGVAISRFITAHIRVRMILQSSVVDRSFAGSSSLRVHRPVYSLRSLHCSNPGVHRQTIQRGQSSARSAARILARYLHGGTRWADFRAIERLRRATKREGSEGKLIRVLR